MRSGHRTGTGLATEATDCNDERVISTVLEPEGPSPAVPLRLWLVRLDVDAETLARAELDLTPAERDRAVRGTPAVRRRRVVLRAATRCALGTVLDVAPARVQLGTSAAGRPEVRDREDVDVNCSASGDVGVVAVAIGARVGVDLEAIAPWSPDAVEEAWLADEERRALLRLPQAARAVALSRCWTQKEAVLKAMGTGLTRDPASVRTPVGAPAGRIAGWHVRGVDVPPGWVASVATSPRSGPGPSVSGGRPVPTDLLTICEATA
jgi:4'-phosphopantetheinyl transferase